ncbi:MAG TPA: ABC transporter substrate-binding protein [Rhodoblastus sp.]|nr:ABC transporter substrate-binding protein [Rhodoblastus sp.]
MTIRFIHFASLRSRAAAVAVIGASLVFTAAPGAAEERRIVALGGAVTEILYALGQQDRIVAVDTTSLYPPEALKTKPNVGYFRALSAEGILSVQPTLVVAVDGAGPPAALAAIEQAHVPVERAPDTPTPEGVATKIRAVGRAVQAQAQADKLADDVERRFGELAEARAKIKDRKRVLFILSLQNGRAIVGGRGTAADAMITLAGGVNAAADLQGYKPMTDEALLAAAPEAIVMMDLGPDAKTEDVFARPALAGSPAARTHALISMNGLYLIGFGPRAPEAARDLMARLYPAQN